MPHPDQPERTVKFNALWTGDERLDEETYRVLRDVILASLIAQQVKFSPPLFSHGSANKFFGMQLVYMSVRGSLEYFDVLSAIPRRISLPPEAHPAWVDLVESMLAKMDELYKERNEGQSIFDVEDDGFPEELFCGEFAYSGLGMAHEAGELALSDQENYDRLRAVVDSSPISDKVSWGLGYEFGEASPEELEEDRFSGHGFQYSGSEQSFPVFYEDPVSFDFAREPDVEWVVLAKRLLVELNDIWKEEDEAYDMFEESATMDYRD
jgi:hypothetical protein